MRSRTRLAVASAPLVLSILLAACGGGSSSQTADSVSPTSAPPSTSPITTPPSTSPTSVVPPTVPERTDVDDPPTDAVPVEWIDNDGAVSLDSALTAFALAVGPLPGVAEPDVRPSNVPEGSAAMRWLMQHLDELTAEQRAAAAAAMSPVNADGTPLAAAEPAGFRRVGKNHTLPTNPCFAGAVVLSYDLPGTKQFRPLVDAAISKLKPHLGPLPIPVWLGFHTFGDYDADAMGYNSDCSKPARSCTVRVHVDAVPGAYLAEVLAHEIVHCYQAATISINDFMNRRDWLIEGFPTFAMAEVEGPQAAAEWWPEYLTTAGRSLYSRSYDAFAVWWHVRRIGQDPWSTFAAALKEENSSDDALKVILGPAWETFGDTWGAGFLRESQRGEFWDADGPGIPPDKSTAAPRQVTNGSVVPGGVVSGGTWLAHLDLSGADVVIVDVESGVGRWSFDGGSDMLVAEVDDTPLCVIGDCTCPEGTVGAGVPTRPADSSAAVLALTGLDTAALVEITGMSLDDFCGEKAEPPINITVTESDSGSTFDECLVGGWRSETITDPGPAALPELDSTGGAGALMSIYGDGSIEFNFDPMEAMVSYVPDIDTIYAAVSYGYAGGWIEASGGTITFADIDSAGTVHELKAGDLVMSMPAGPAHIVIPKDGTPYVCTDTHLTFDVRDDVEGGSFPVPFVRL